MRSKLAISWEAIIGVSAIVTAVVSLAVGIQQTRIQQQTLAASTWPYLALYSSGLTEDHRPRMALGVSNEGVGPAKIESITASYKGRLYASSGTLLRDCCMPKSAKPDVVYTTLAQSVIPAHDRIDYLIADYTPKNRALWEALSTVPQRVVVTICYCSVLDECWTINSQSQEPPAQVRNCSPATPQFDG